MCKNILKKFPCDWRSVFDWWVNRIKGRSIFDITLIHWVVHKELSKPGVHLKQIICREFELWTWIQLALSFRIQIFCWVVRFERISSVNVLLCLQQENSFIWNMRRNETESRIFYFQILIQSLHIATKTCFSRTSFFLILVYCKICIYLHSDAFEYSTNNAFCRQSAESYLKKEHSKVLKTRRTHKISDQKAGKIQERK